MQVLGPWGAVIDTCCRLHSVCAPRLRALQQHRAAPGLLGLAVALAAALCVCAGDSARQRVDASGAASLLASAVRGLTDAVCCG